MPDGTRYRGAAAINAVLGIALGTRMLLRFYQLPMIRQIQDQVYAWVVRNRHRLPGITPYCQQFPADCDVKAEA